VGRPRTARAGPAGSAGRGSRRWVSRSALTTRGEVLARSNHVFAGYWRQPEESAAVHTAGPGGRPEDDKGWFRTGDGGFMDGPHLTIEDRKKDVIISGGENVSSIEVEGHLYQHPAVAEVAVIGVPDERWGETVKALVVARPGTAVRRGRADRGSAATGWRTSSARHRSSFATACPARPPAAAEVQAPVSPTGRTGDAGSIDATPPLDGSVAGSGVDGRLAKVRPRQPAGELGGEELLDAVEGPRRGTR